MTSVRPQTVRRAVQIVVKVFMFDNPALGQDLDVNLMLYGGLPKANWRDHVYHSLDQLAEPSKALARWATGEAVGVGFSSSLTKPSRL